MKTVILLLVFGAGVWFAYQWLQRPAAQAVLKAPEKYVKSLAEDEKRAIEAAQKANDAIRRTQQAVNQAVEDAK